MNINEVNFINRINNAKADIRNAMLYIKENYNIDSEYDEENGTVSLSVVNEDNILNNALLFAAAKEYIEGQVGDDIIQVVF